MTTVEFHDDPALVLSAAGDFLARDPLTSTVVATVTERAAADEVAGVVRDPEVPRWWALVRDGHGEVIGLVMRTAPAAPYPLYVLPMSEEAAELVARRLHERAERVDAVNGSLPAARQVAEELARLTGRQVDGSKGTRLFEVRRLRASQRRPEGRLRVATASDLELVAAWLGAFAADAAEQAGRDPDSAVDLTDHDPAAVGRRIAAGGVWLWELPDGTVTQLTAASPPAHGVVRIGPVFTPREHRGRGYASAAVAEVSARMLGLGHRVCLFTDQANPTSNRVYEALGYQRVADLTELELIEP